VQVVQACGRGFHRNNRGFCVPSRVSRPYAYRRNYRPYGYYYGGGNEYLIEGDKIAKGLFSFGLFSRDWAKVRYPDNPSLGNIEADFFEPRKWKTEYPQPAFGQMDAADAFWAASIVSRFNDEMIRAIVDEGRLSDPEAASYLTDVIKRRRDKVVAYWIAQTNPLDTFAVSRSSAGTELTFDNAAIRLGVARPAAGYKARWMALDNVKGTETNVGGDIDLADARIAIPGSAWGPRDEAGNRYAVASIASAHANFPQWASPVLVTVRERNGAVDVVGIERPAGRDEREN